MVCNFMCRMVVVVVMVGHCNEVDEDPINNSSSTVVQTLQQQSQGQASDIAELWGYNRIN